MSLGAREPPYSSRLPACRVGRRVSVLATGAGRARAFVCGWGTKTRSTSSYSIQSALLFLQRRVSATSPLSEHYKRGAPPRTAQPIGPPYRKRSLVGQLHRRSLSPVRHWAPRGGAPADR